MKTLSFIGPIKNYMLLRDANNFPKDFEKITLENVLQYPLVNGLKIDYQVTASCTAVSGQ